MKNVAICLLGLLLLSCNEKTNPLQNNYQEDAINTDKESVNENSPENENYLILDSSMSFVKITKQEEEHYEYEMLENNYSIEYLAPEGKFANYLQKRRIKTISSTVNDIVNREIQIELLPYESQNLKTIKLKEKCHKLELKEKYYNTYTYGCCAEPMKLAVFSYKREPIIFATDRIIRADIWNNPKIDGFWFGFEITENNQKPLTIGILTLSYGTNDIYKIEFVAKNEEDNLIEKNSFTPQISIVSENTQDKMNYVEGVFQIMSLNKIKSFSEINGFAIEVLIYNKNENPETISIPIINGKPFGKNERNQKLTIE